MPTSPDLSPISTTSALLTPTDLSPATKTFDQKLPPHFDFNGVFRHSDNNSLMFETGFRDGSHISQTAPWPSAQSFNPDGGYFTDLEPFLESSAPSMPRGQGLFPLSPQSERRRLESNVLPPSLPPLSWAGQRTRTSSSEWLKADSAADRGLHLGTSDSGFRSIPTQQVLPPQRQTSAQVHEVSATV